MRTKLVFCTNQYTYFQDKLCQEKGFVKGDLERDVFPDGERYQRISGSVRDRDVIVIGGTVDDAETLSLYDLAFGLVQHGANQLTMLVPYFGYATMERAVRPGEIVTAKTRAVLLSSIPQARFSNEIVMVDLHTGGIPHYFEDHIRPYHLSAKNVIAAIVRELESPHKVLASTDAGRAKWIENLANEIGIDAAFVYKRRFDGESTAIRGINANVEGRHVVIYDDMIRTGGSLVRAAQAYREAGAARLTAIATHGVLPGNALGRIRESGLFDRVYLTDTHPRVRELEAEETNEFLQIRSIVPEVARFLNNREDYGANGYLHT